MARKKIQTALVSVYSKEGLEPIIRQLHALDVRMLSTGGTQRFIESLGIPVQSVESLTSYPSILDGRVKTLHPKVFGGLLARREESHLADLQQYEIPEIDLVIVDLYPFEETLAQTKEETAIIEKIDIGGISLIRAAAKNFNDVVVVPSRAEYGLLARLLEEKQGYTELPDRKALAGRAFDISSHYDTAIYQYFQEDVADKAAFKQSVRTAQPLRYGENPHQKGTFYGSLDQMFDKLNGKALSFNNLVDIDAAVGLMREFRSELPAFAVLKHTNSCGVAVRKQLPDAWKAALAGDPVSAFGGVLITNRQVDLETARAIDEIFYEVLIAPDFSGEALELLRQKQKRIILRIKEFFQHPLTFKRLLHGVIEQEADLKTENRQELELVTQRAPTEGAITDLLFANKVVKHLKSNAIALVKDQQLIGMGCGQTSRVDALRQAIAKARNFDFDPAGAVMASDAFFPFSDSVEIAYEAGITAVIQPGGSIRDKDSVRFCDDHQMSMVLTGIRHFKH